MLSSVAATEAEAKENKSEEKDTAEPEAEEGYFSTLDYALLGALGLGAAWYFFFREKKEEAAAPSYVIQPASMPSMSMSANRYRERQGFGWF